MPGSPYPTAAPGLGPSLPSPVDPAGAEALAGLRCPYTFLPQVPFGNLAAQLHPKAWVCGDGDLLLWCGLPPAALARKELYPATRETTLFLQKPPKKDASCAEFIPKRSAWVELILSWEGSGGENVGSCGLRFCGGRTCLAQWPCASDSLRWVEGEHPGASQPQLLPFWSPRAALPQRCYSWSECCGPGGPGCGRHKCHCCHLPPMAVPSPWLAA